MFLDSRALGNQDVTAEPQADEALIRHILEQVGALIAGDLLAVANFLGILQKVGN